MDFALQLLRLAASLAIVLGLLLALMYGLRRWGHIARKQSSQPAMEVISRQSFGPRHHLLLVKVPGGQNVLVGISPQTMSLIPNVPGPQNMPATVEKTEIV